MVFLMETKDLRAKLEQCKGQVTRITQQIETITEKASSTKKEMVRWTFAREIIKTVGQLTQDKLKAQVSAITSTAMEAVFNDPYEVKIQFVQRRNQTECDITFVRDGIEYDPMLSSGGGAVDIASLSLRIACLIMQQPQSRNVLVLDEPLRFLSADLQPRASEMLNKISNMLSVQMIIVSHNEHVIDNADKVFEVTKSNGVSKVCAVN